MAPSEPGGVSYWGRSPTRPKTERANKRPTRTKLHMNMLSKFAIDYTALRQHSNRVFTHQTDDPVEVEEFLMHLLTTGCRIREIRHQGERLSSAQFDRMLKVAADQVAANLLRDSLDIDAIAVRDRFGYAA